MLHGKGLAVYTGCETICRTERSFEGNAQLTMAVTQIVDGARPPVWPTDLNDFVVLLPSRGCSGDPKDPLIEPLLSTVRTATGMQSPHGQSAARQSIAVTGRSFTQSRASCASAPASKESRCHQWS